MHARYIALWCEIFFVSLFSVIEIGYAKYGTPVVFEGVGHRATSIFEADVVSISRMAEVRVRRIMNYQGERAGLKKNFQVGNILQVPNINFSRGRTVVLSIDRFN